MSYAEFLASKAQPGQRHGFEPTYLPDALFPFQRDLVTWAVRQGRGAIFADCGLGKTLMQLAWAQNVIARTNRPVLVLTPLAVAAQTVAEGARFGIECARSSGDLAPGARVVVTNYQRLHRFSAANFSGVVCDESSILKNFDGETRGAVTEFLRTIPYRLLATATASPNDYVELGTSSEALGELGQRDMLGQFFKNDQNSIQAQRTWSGSEWRFKPHAEADFWRWVCSWARAVRRPSDLGHDDGAFVLPPLIESQTVVKAPSVRPGFLFDLPAEGLKEQREERRRTLRERCEAVARIVERSDSAVVWCHGNDEGDLLERLISGAIQVSGKDDDDAKEEKFTAFSSGSARVLVTKPKIGAWGLNWQHCAHQTFFPSHSFEQYYQAVRRCWRFGQKRPVRVDVVASEGEANVMSNLRRKSDQADAMFASLVRFMNESVARERGSYGAKKEQVPAWL